MKKIIALITAVMTLGASVCASAFYKGGDMTEVTYIEDLGGVYKDENGNAVDPFEFLASKGMNMARIRLSNNPGKGRGDGTYYLPEGYQDEADCLELSKRAADAGMEIQFTFNYSDYWSNGDRQIIPADWVDAIKADLGYDVKDAKFLNSMTDEQTAQIRAKLGDLVYGYTKDIMTKLKNQGTVPKYVSLGNEINGGILFPFANTFDANMNSDRFELVYDDNTDEEHDIKCHENWQALADILNRGYDAVKEVSPESEVVLHLANGSQDGTFTWFFDKYLEAGGKVDVIGASYYPAWSGNPIETCAAFCHNISIKYDKNILIMETGYNWNPKKKNGYEGQLTANAEGYNEKYPFTQDGQYNFLNDLFNQLEMSSAMRCVGVLYWDPAMIHVEDPENPNESLSGWAYNESDDKPAGNVVENTTLFDFDGKAVKAVKALRTNGRISAYYFVFDGRLANVFVENSTHNDASVQIIITEYDENGALSGVKTENIDVEAESYKTAEIKLDYDKCGVYIWNDGEIVKISKYYRAVAYHR